jgi:hypothetical protein
MVADEDAVAVTGADAFVTWCEWEHGDLRVLEGRGQCAQHRLVFASRMLTGPPAYSTRFSGPRHQVTAAGLGPGVDLPPPRSQQAPAFQVENADDLAVWPDTTTLHQARLNGNVP